MTGSAVLVLNCGSSSIKYQVVDVSTADRLAHGLAERIGEESSRLGHTAGGRELEWTDPIPDHQRGLETILRALQDTGPDPDAIGLAAVGHRVVHGGERFADPVLIDDTVAETIERLIPLAPLHNPANLTGIRVARGILPRLPHVAVFDTAFHQTIPPHAYTYAVPRHWRTDYGVRRYGFHGTSFAYVARAAVELLGRDPAETNLIVAHLGNGASITAVAGGRSVDTSMGLTPLEGLVMGTRSGDLDPAVASHLWRVAGVSVEQSDEALNRASGLLALAGANDMREVQRRADNGDEDAQLALEVYCYRLRKYVGAYCAVLGRVDAVVFTAGIGENAAYVRARSLAGLDRFGIAVDPERNAAPGKGARYISPEAAETAVLVVPTDEELEIARQAHAVATEQ